MDAALRSFGINGDALELADGTGWWTERLARTADRLTVLDAAPEALALNRQRVGREDVSFVVADLFDWRPERAYDVVFFSFLAVSRAKAPLQFLLEPCAGLTATNRSSVLHRQSPRRRGLQPSGWGDPYVVEYGSDLHRRRLGDGSEYLVVKVMYEPDELRALIESEDWHAQIDSTRWLIFGSARPCL